MILDVCCGGMLMYQGWNGKLGDGFITMDVRKGDFSVYSEKNWAVGPVIIKPLVLADMRYLPFRPNLFYAIIFDPPHTNAGIDSWVWKKFGAWSKVETIRTLRAANKEFPRVLKDHGFLLLKTYRSSFALYETLLSNFVFFLPIERRSGAFRYKGRKILWAMAQCNFYSSAKEEKVT